MSKYNVKYQPKSVVEVRMEITDEEIQNSFKKAVKKIAKSVSIPGFRKGKAPEAMVEGSIGKDKIYEDALNTLIPEEFEKALKESQTDTKQRIMLLNYPDYKLEGEWKPGQQLVVTASAIVYPKVTVDKIESDLKASKPAKEDVTDKEVSESIEKIFQQYKKIRAQDAKEKAGNINNESQSTDAPVEVEMDDEFAKAAGAQNLDDLKSLVKSEIEYDKGTRVERQYEEELIKKAQELVDIDMPDLLIDEEVNRIEQRFIGQLDKLGITFDTYLQTESKTKEQVRAEWVERAKENTKIALILQEIRIKNDIKVSDEEIKLLALQNGIKSGISQEQHNTLAYVIGQSKALEKLKEMASK